jgi:DNA polymerase-3 subunit delta'
MSLVYPWQRQHWQGLIARLQRHELPHALLFTGPAGMGKLHFADCLARAILCESTLEDGSACGHCRGCLLMKAGNHPDYLRIEPEEEGKGIGIDVIRHLINFQSLKSQYGRQRVVQLHPAERINRAASNALLKTLEEPAGDTVLLLCSDRPSALLPTVRSRCQQLLFRPLAEPNEETQQWLRAQLDDGNADVQQLLQASAGAPLAALALLQNGELAQRETLLVDLADLAANKASPVALAEQWVRVGIERVLAALYSLLADMIQLKSLHTNARLSNPGLQGNLQALAEQVDLSFLDALLLRVQERSGLLQGQVKPLVILEEILLAWKQRRV